MVVLTEILPEPSSQVSEHRYDIYLSFRGADTRLGFTDHLYNALLDADIKTFLDDEEIETGKPLKPELESAIKSSRASIIVLSKNYALSTWCLDELVLILEQKRNFNQIVIPIFYHVDPTHVRKQQSSFGDAMEAHKQRMETEADPKKRSQRAQKMELWKRALTEVARLKGKSASDRKESELIEEVVTKIQHRLSVPIRNTLPLIIGRDDYIKLISLWLNEGSSHSANVLTIVGKGGIGKTSLAKYVFVLHSSKFHKSSFIEGINTRCNQHFNGLLDLQKQLHIDISRETPLQVNDVAVYASEMVFVVLDDIGSPDQLDALLGDECLYPGSKIIITTKDACLTERSALFNLKLKPTHVQVLLSGIPYSESLELLCIHAFKRNAFIKEGYEFVSKQLVEYCEGHPLALEVLGGSLHKQDVAYWEDCIKALKKEPRFRIKQALKVSFESLPFENDKDLFKHIACFFVGEDRDVTETILNACDINTVSGITNLIDRCLLRIGWNNKLMMHELAQEMGRDLVRQESPDKPWKRSRLWYHVESFDVLKQNKGTENVLGLALDMRMLEKEDLSGLLPLKTDSFSKMDNLKLLQLNYVKISGSYENISKDLRWLCMHGFHLKSIPPELPMENLVVLDMSHSNIESFDMSYGSSQQFVSKLKGSIGSNSKGKRLLGSLKILDLSFCEQLHSVGGFFELPVLEKLKVSNCTSLIKIGESIRHCVELVFIDLSNCKKLRKLPRTVGMLKKLKTLSSNGCDLVFPTELKGMNSLRTLMEDKNGINSQISSSASMDAKLRYMSLLSLKNYNVYNVSLPVKSLTTLEKLYLKGNPLVSVPSWVSNLSILLVVLSLKNCNLSNESFPVDFSSLSMLKKLYLDGNPLVSVPSWVGNLPRLEQLSMVWCRKLKTAEYVQTYDISPVQGLIGSNSKGERWLGSLKMLDLRFCEQLHSVGCFIDFPALEILNISNCTSLIKVSESIRHCVELVYIPRDMRFLTSYLPISLVELSLINCDFSRKSFPVDFSSLPMLKRLELDENSFNSVSSWISNLPVIEQVRMVRCIYLKISNYPQPMLRTKYPLFRFLSPPKLKLQDIIIRELSISRYLIRRYLKFEYYL